MRPAAHAALAALTALTTLLTACGGGGGGGGNDAGGGNPPPAAAPLARVSPLAAGGTCTTGGAQLQLGRDANANGALDSAEVEATYALCNGQPGGSGAAALARVEDLAPGSACANGGVRVASGLDSNANTRLDDTEVSATQHLCRGAAGAAALPLVLTLDTEPAGSACAAGGLRVRSGLDADGNGRISGAELEREQLLCAGVNGAPQSRLQVQPDTSCPAGGQRIDIGLDLDGDGQLGSSEITATSRVCDGSAGSPGPSGATGATSLLAWSAEPAGATCAAGGWRLDAGHDSNGDGQLDLGEITSTRRLCNASTGATGAAGLTSLLVVSTEPAGSTCAAGGRRLDSGLDLDNNGQLAGSEITGTGFVCDGAAGATGTAGLASLVRQDDAGAACTHGGREFASGLDANRNGTLDATEVAAVERACNGSAGAPGGSGGAGRDALITLSNEPAGANCAAGGSRIDSGVDANSNAVLDASEVASTRYVCAAAAGTSFTWVQATGGGRAVTMLPQRGYLAVGSTAASALTLPTAAAVGDLVRVSGAGAAGWRLGQGAGQRIDTSAAGARAVRRSSVLAQAVVVGPATAATGLAVSADLQRLLAAPGSGTLRLSTDGGATWRNTGASRSWTAAAVSANGERLFAVAQTGGVHISVDAGLTWADFESNRNWSAVATTPDGLHVMAAEANGAVYASSDGGATWTALPLSGAWKALALSADGRRRVALRDNGTILVSADGGATWADREQARPWVAVAMSGDGQRLLPAAGGGRLYLSSDGGATWAARLTDTAWAAVAVSADGLRLVASDSAGPLWQSENGGTTWAQRPLAPGALALAASRDGADWLLGTSAGTLLLSLAERGERGITSSTTSGSTGALSGGPGSSVELQHLGQGQYLLRGSSGVLWVD
jgi:photosystem II stability/assembly factor-like uncharacterized protein